jgi:F-type H+-transporting ATPase subunit epsilon
VLKIRLINPEEIVFDGEATYVLAPTKHGTIGIMPGHTPFYGELTKGDLIIFTTEEKTWPIEAGLLKVRADEVTILIGL